MTRGGNHSTRWIYPDKATAIREAIKSGWSYSRITQIYGISAGHISNINHGKYYYDEKYHKCEECEFDDCNCAQSVEDFELGDNDHSLMQRLANAGTDHRKFMRMMPVYVRITAPLYW